MANKSFSKFYYGFNLTEKNNSIDFQEGSTVITAFLRLGAYTLSEFAIELSRAMSEAGGQDYSWSVDRETRELEAYADASFDLLCFSGPSKGSTVFGLAGHLLDADKTGLNTYESDFGAGSEYKAQMWLQDYTPFENWQEASGASRSQSSAGVVEIVSFGNVRKMECTFSYITNKPIGMGAVWEENINGLQDFIHFLKAITSGGRCEFMEDRDDVDNYNKCILESSPGYKDATGFKIKELTNEKLPDFFKYGPLVFREVL
jgi:hypothetical protein